MVTLELECHYNGNGLGMVYVTWNPNNAIDIGKGSICKGGWLERFYWSVAPLGNEAVGTMIRYRTQSYYPETELPATCHILRSDKYQFCKSLIWRKRELNSRPSTREACALPIRLLHWVMTLYSWYILNTTEVLHFSDCDRRIIAVYRQSFNVLFHLTTCSMTRHLLFQDDIGLNAALSVKDMHCCTRSPYLQNVQWPNL